MRILWLNLHRFEIRESSNQSHIRARLHRCPVEGFLNPDLTKTVQEHGQDHRECGNLDDERPAGRHASSEGELKPHRRGEGSNDRDPAVQLIRVL